MDLNKIKPAFEGESGENPLFDKNKKKDRAKKIPPVEENMFHRGVEKSDNDPIEFAYKLAKKIPEDKGPLTPKTLMAYGATPLEAAKATGMSNQQMFLKLKKAKVLDIGVKEGEKPLDKKIRQDKIMRAYGFSDKDVKSILTPKQLRERAIRKRKDSLGTMSPLTYRDAKKLVEQEAWGNEEMGTGEYAVKSARAGINSVAKILNQTIGVGDKEK